MNTILLAPTDVLFFRDGRPMGGSSSGHGAAWPLPSVINHAFHAALHRADFTGVHEHRRGKSGSYEEMRDRKFGSLVTAGPFPVCTNGTDHTWFFPRPADADDSGLPVLLPTKSTNSSSLTAPCRYPVTSTKPPSKETPKPWWNEGAWNNYLNTSQGNSLSSRAFRKSDIDFSDTEHTYGIEIADETGSVVDGQFYSAHYLRLREGWKLGLFAAAPDKDYRHEAYGNDLVRSLFNGNGTEIIAGGQQRICTATLDKQKHERLPLPLGKTSNFNQVDGKYLVKWVLLTPAIFPQIGEHTGGWLPSWIRQKDGKVMLKSGDTERRQGERRDQWRERVKLLPKIQASLVAAVVNKPLPVTGWALPNDTDRPEGGAKPTHLAVPAGAIYYFEADSPQAAQDLAAALNWHGSENAKPQIINRRSTLMGEKGFGLGVCGTWHFHS